jgi:hypothetical protein
MSTSVGNDSISKHRVNKGYGNWPLCCVDISQKPNNSFNDVLKCYTYIIIPSAHITFFSMYINETSKRRYRIRVLVGTYILMLVSVRSSESLIHVINNGAHLRETQDYVQNYENT